MHRTADIEFTVSLTELKRAFRRLSARLPDESEAGEEFVVSDACDSNLEIMASRTSEGLSASVVYPGRARVPFPVIRGVARVMRFYREKTVRLTFSAGVFRVDHTEFRHAGITALPTLDSVRWDG
jgi:hypothetical protein